jgi:hypothetical protein
MVHRERAWVLIDEHLTELADVLSLHIDIFTRGRLRAVSQVFLNAVEATWTQTLETLEAQRLLTVGPSVAFTASPAASARAAALEDGKPRERILMNSLREAGLTSPLWLCVAHEKIAQGHRTLRSAEHFSRQHFVPRFYKRGAEPLTQSLSGSGKSLWEADSRRDTWEAGFCQHALQHSERLADALMGGGDEAHDEELKRLLEEWSVEPSNAHASLSARSAHSRHAAFAAALRGTTTEVRVEEWRRIEP